MVRIGKLQLDAPFFQAGLAGYSDAAMRLVARRHGAPYAVTEALLDTVLIHGGKGLKEAQLDPADHPIAGQIIGTYPHEMAAAAKIIAGLGYDVVDVNLACPVKKIRKRCRGGHLMSHPDQAIALLDAVRQATPPDVPCTIKLRRGSDDSPQAEADFHRIFAAAIRLGYAGAVVHGRTVAQKYIGSSHWPFLTALVQRYQGTTVAHAGSNLAPYPGAPAFVLGGSGDIWTAADIFRMIAETGVHLVSLARGCIGNPWIFTQARAGLAGDRAGAQRPPTLAQQRAVLLEHFALAVRRHGEYRSARRMRKFGIRFARHHPASAQVAKAFIAVQTIADWHAVVDTFYGAPESAVAVFPALH